MKVIIIGGFLGSGKTTTLLKVGKYLNDKGEKIAIIVNEIGEIGVDGTTLDIEGVETREITNGCICCTLKIDMEQALDSLAEEYRPDTVIIEPTGVAFPRQIKEEIELMKIADMEFSPIINLIDGSRFDLEIEQIPKFIKTQIEDADILGINKIDVATDEQVSKVKALLQHYNTDAKILEFSAKENAGNFEELIETISGEGKQRDHSVKQNSIAESNVSSHAIEYAIETNDLEFKKGHELANDIVDSILSQFIQLNPDFIGHIKISMDLPETFLKISLTSSTNKPEIEIFERENVAKPKVRALAAVTNIRQDEVVKILENTIEETFNETGITLQRIQQHTDTKNIINLCDISI
ncbi:CobW family GTP-binding protein [Methanohalophilus mahii]|uniref:Cobalamin synthesis protein P47K n=1 Tax=Methanohalophilus mahii (strain ATCC 35705 / DSM 5219 / SLP) TaxID=547558 RepID=D5EB71_METMS|nr:GTP-binding protein [Methanohalophilus mahii]ADE36422.1 cobalamin synthesis protein P47K [Methanohalophilus mahii DSM 5219]